MSEIYSPAGNVGIVNIMRATIAEAGTGAHGQEFMRDNITRILDRIRFLADDGFPNVSKIPFPAVQVPSAGANDLDDYEEGAFTPTLRFGAASVGITYGTQAGKYTKIGNLVTGHLRIILTSKGSSAGSADITGLPFTSATIGNVAAPQSNATTMNTAFVPQHYVGGGAVTITLAKGNLASSAPIADTDFTNTTVLELSFQYTV